MQDLPWPLWESVNARVFMGMGCVFLAPGSLFCGSLGSHLCGCSFLLKRLVMYCHMLCSSWTGLEESFVGYRGTSNKLSSPLMWYRMYCIPPSSVRSVDAGSKPPVRYEKGRGGKVVSSTEFLTWQTSLESLSDSTLILSWVRVRLILRLKVRLKEVKVLFEASVLMGLWGDLESWSASLSLLLSWGVLPKSFQRKLPLRNPPSLPVWPEPFFLSISSSEPIFLSSNTVILTGLVFQLLWRPRRITSGAVDCWATELRPSTALNPSFLLLCCWLFSETPALLKRCWARGSDVTEPGSMHTLLGLDSRRSCSCWDSLCRSTGPPYILIVLLPSATSSRWGLRNTARGRELCSVQVAWPLRIGPFPQTVTRLDDECCCFWVSFWAVSSATSLRCCGKFLERCFKNLSVLILPSTSSSHSCRTTSSCLCFPVPLVWLKEGHLLISCCTLPNLGLFSIGTKFIICPFDLQFSTRLWVTRPIFVSDTAASLWVSFRITEMW